jgi:hypothetical protein
VRLASHSDRLRAGGGHSGVAREQGRGGGGAEKDQGCDPGTGRERDSESAAPLLQPEPALGEPERDALNPEPQLLHYENLMNKPERARARLSRIHRQ